ncbi:MAG TPA: porphobilinogen synthase [Nitrososphaerales archaeon]|nr:porphobilinogen synthase [Nitrososphaerales archaeon]
MLEERAGRFNRRVDERLRRLRRTETIREILKENRVHVSNLMAPVFVRGGERIVEPVEAMPGVNRYSVDAVSDYVGRLTDEGVRSVVLFGIPDSKDDLGSGAYSSDGVVPKAIRELKSHFGSLVVAADVCLCEYTSHGHCGVMKDGSVSNEMTLPLLTKAALQYAGAGADIVCPSAMMDGQVLAIRKGLDGSGYEERLVMGYSAKYASSFYGPFREAAGSAPAFGDRKGYQMNPANSREAMREIESDIREGADIIMVKPALAYLDVISRARSRYDVPLAAYSVSGEYSMVKAAGAQGWLDEKSAAMEIATSIKRAGADIIITYFAEQLAVWLREEV